MTLLALLELIVTGAVAGITAGFLGVGGGVVLTPLCLVIYPHMGVESDSLIKVIFGTNMVCMTLFSLSAVIRHHENYGIDWRMVMFMGPLAVIGSWCGGWTASIINPVYLKIFFGILLMVSSLFIVIRNSHTFGERSGQTGFSLPKSMLPLLGLGTGFIGSLLGIGGGVVMIPALIILFAFPAKYVAGTSSSVIVFSGLAGVAAYIWYGRGIVELPGWSSGYVWWSAALPLALGGVPFARAGAWLNGKIHATLLEKIFGVFLFLVSIKILLT